MLLKLNSKPRRTLQHCFHHIKSSRYIKKQFTCAIPLFFNIHKLCNIELISFILFTVTLITCNFSAVTGKLTDLTSNFGQLIPTGDKRTQNRNEDDPNIRFLCQGALSEYVACLCNDANEFKIEVACINAQFVDISVFQHLNTYYKHAKKITFHGNNFQDLPHKTPLFGVGTDGLPTLYPDLNLLNLSANYIVNLHRDALKATPNIEILDLSNNEIVLTEENVHFLDHTSKLTDLFLRRAFTSVVNRTKQFKLMLDMFNNANLNRLRLLDLSYNFLASVPYNLGCSFTSLSFLDLRQNLLKSISINTTCLASIKIIDLSRNHFQRLDKKFQEDFGNLLPANSLLLRNSFLCDCKSIEYLKWLRSTNVLREKNLLTCFKASPANFVGARLVDVSLHLLDCNINFDKKNSFNRTTTNFSFLVLLLTIFILIIIKF